MPVATKRSNAGRHRIGGAGGRRHCVGRGDDDQRCPDEHHRRADGARQRCCRCVRATSAGPPSDASSVGGGGGCTPSHRCAPSARAAAPAIAGIDRNARNARPPRSSPQVRAVRRHRRRCPPRDAPSDADRAEEPCPIARGGAMRQCITQLRATTVDPGTHGADLHAEHVSDLVIHRPSTSHRTTATRNFSGKDESAASTSGSKPASWTASSGSDVTCPEAGSRRLRRIRPCGSEQRAERGRGRGWW